MTPGDVEQRLRDAIKREREFRAWSYATLAEQMETIAGFKIAPATLWKIEEGDPPRQVKPGELLAFSTVFDTSADVLLSGRDEVGAALSQAMWQLINALKARRELQNQVAALSGIVDYAQERLAELVKRSPQDRNNLETWLRSELRSRELKQLIHELEVIEILGGAPIGEGNRSLREGGY